MTSKQRIITARLRFHTDKVFNMNERQLADRLAEILRFVDWLDVVTVTDGDPLRQMPEHSHAHPREEP